MSQWLHKWYTHRLNRTFWFGAIRSVAPRLPDWFVRASIFLITLGLFVYLGQERRAMMKTMKIITGRPVFPRSLLAFRLLHNFSRQFKSFVLHDRYPDSYWQQRVIQNQEYVNAMDRALERGKGLILLSAHMGNWEFGKYVLARKKQTVHMVMTPAEDSTAEDFWNQFRSRSGVHIINLKSSPFAVLEIREALSRNEVVVMHGDRVINQSAISVPFFGRQAWFPSGPFELARLTGAPVLPAFILLEKNDTCRVIVDDSLTLSWTGDRKGDIVLHVSQYARLLEKYVSRYPDQWYVFYDFWEIPDPATAAH